MGQAIYTGQYRDYDYLTLVCCLTGIRVYPLVSCQVPMGLQKENNSEIIRLAHLLLLQKQQKGCLTNPALQ